MSSRNFLTRYVDGVNVVLGLALSEIFNPFHYTVPGTFITVSILVICVLVGRLVMKKTGTDRSGENLEKKI